MTFKKIMAAAMALSVTAGAVPAAAYAQGGSNAAGICKELYSAAEGIEPVPITAEQLIGDWVMYKAVDLSTGNDVSGEVDLVGVTFTFNADGSFLRDGQTAAVWFLQDGIVYVFDEGFEDRIVFDGTDLIFNDDVYAFMWRKADDSQSKLTAADVAGSWEPYRTVFADGSTEYYSGDVYVLKEDGSAQLIHDSALAAEFSWEITDAGLRLYTNDGWSESVYVYDGTDLSTVFEGNTYYWRRYSGEQQSGLTDGSVIGSWISYKVTENSSGEDVTAEHPEQLEYLFSEDHTVEIVIDGTPNQSMNWTVSSGALMLYDDYTIVDAECDGTELSFSDGTFTYHFRREGIQKKPINTELLVGGWEIYKVLDVQTDEDATEVLGGYHLYFNTDGTYEIVDRDGNSSTYNWYIEDNEVRTYSTNEAYYSFLIYDGTDLVYNDDSYVYFCRRSDFEPHILAVEELTGTWEVYKSVNLSTDEVTPLAGTLYTLLPNMTFTSSYDGNTQSGTWEIVNGEVHIYEADAQGYYVLGYDGNELIYSYGNYAEHCRRYDAPQGDFITVEEVIGDWEIYKVLELETGNDVSSDFNFENFIYTYKEDFTYWIDDGETNESYLTWYISGDELHLYDSDPSNYSTVTIDGTDLVYEEGGYRYYWCRLGSKRTLLGDVNGDGLIDPADASLILIANAEGADAVFDAAQIEVADVNGDHLIDGVDASLILTYNAYCADGGTSGLPEWLSSIQSSG